MSGARQAPRYTGVRTFGGLAHAPLAGIATAANRPATEAEAPTAAGRPAAEAGRPAAAVVGVPFDTATSWRPGARFGPEAIRSASALLRPWHPRHRIDVFAATGAVDGGDVTVTPGNAARTAEQIAAALQPLCAAGCVPLALGGDHSILLGELRAQAAVHGPLALVQLDAHADTWEDYYGERLFHGTVLRRAVEEKVLDPERSLIAGVRGPVYEPRDLEDARALGFELIAIEELRELAAGELAARVSYRTGGAPVHLSFDIDVIDPAAAPATGTPEVGGLLASEALALLRALAGTRFVGFDLVEVSPPYDGPGQITALLAANLLYEMLALVALASSTPA